MINKSLKLSVVLCLALFGNKAQSAFDTLCFFGVNDGAGPTMFHILDWNALDAIVWNRTVSETAVIPPPGIAVSNNPRVDTYFTALEGLEYSAGVFPAPIPSGLWTIQGSSVSMAWQLKPIFRVTVHPDSPFPCASTDFVS